MRAKWILALGLAALCLTGPVRGAVSVVAVGTLTTLSYDVSGLLSPLEGPNMSFILGKWTLELAYPTPSGEPGASDDWSMRVTMQYEGLSGSRIDYYGVNETSTGDWSINTFECGISSGQFLLASVDSRCALSVLDAPTWTASGYQEVDLSRIPEPGTLALLGLGLAGLAATCRRKQ